jgi:hypothetical protein
MDERRWTGAEMVKPGAIHENVMGKSDAPVTIVEYASLTCPHCATFHTKTLPKREGGLCRHRQGALHLPRFSVRRRGAGRDHADRAAPTRRKFFDDRGTVQDGRRSWAFGKDPEKELRAFAKPYGFTQESFDACLQKKDIYDGVLAGRKKRLRGFRRRCDADPVHQRRQAYAAR